MSGATPLFSIGVLSVPEDFVAFADDQAGCFFGFRPATEQVLALDSHDWSLSEEAPDFPSLMQALLADKS